MADDGMTDDDMADDGMTDDGMKTIQLVGDRRSIDEPPEMPFYN